MNDDMPPYWARARRALSASDPVLGEIIRARPGKFLLSRSDPFVSLARSIVGQQISVKAAQSVWERFSATAPTLEPHAVAKLDQTTLRSCGLSARKAEYIGGLARGFLDGSLRPRSWAELDDEAVIAELTLVKGIGRWTAEMFLMFHLLRPNVLPLADVGLQRAMNLHYNQGRALSARKIKTIAARWQPWCSVATWYMWRSLEN